VILAVAFALRLGLVLERHGDVLFEHPPLDEAIYLALAKGTHLPGGIIAYWQPPGILYFLSVTFTAGGGLLVAHVVQALVGTLACLLLYAIGKRLFSGCVGIASAAVLAMHGVAVFESYELLPATWMMVFDLLAVYLLWLARERKSWKLAFVGGLAIGISAVFGPTILPFALVAVVWLRERRAIAALAIGVVLPIAPVTMRNLRHGELALISTNAPVNFYIGNNADYERTFAIRPGPDWDELIVRPRHQLVDDGVAFWRDHPTSALALFGRKLYLFWNGAEIARDTDIYDVREESSVLRALVAPRGLPFPDGLVIPMAVLGLIAWRRAWRRLGVAYGFIAVQAIVVPAFFVTSRHRVPALPMLTLFAVAAVAWVWTRWRGWTWARRSAAAGLLATIGIACNVPTWESELAFPGEPDFYRARAWRGLNELDRALAATDRAIALQPADPRFWNERGAVLQALDRPAEAAAAYQLAAAEDPGDLWAARRQKDILMGVGDLRGAAVALETSIAAGRHMPDKYARDHLALVRIYAHLGNTQRAVTELVAARLADSELFVHLLPGLTDELLAQSPPVAPAFWNVLAEANASADDIARAAAVRGR
jgi:tetratricopeptide (TPR) repeat protein